jgi:hypothetical protein
MPLLGHAFVGLATGLVIRPFPPNEGPMTTGGRAAAAFWLPATVALAYLPDLATEGGRLVGVGQARVIAHSVLFALGMAPVIAALGVRLGGLSWPRALGITLGSILLHDALDVAQSSDRHPWWPFSDHPAGLGAGLVPADPRREALLFAALFAFFLIGRMLVTRIRSRAYVPPAPTPLTWAGRAFILLFVVAAALTHVLRDAREHELDDARLMLEQERPREALRTLAHAERWPSTAKPGRVDHLRGEAWLKLGDRVQAEHYYRRSYEADRDFFWVVADLAAFYATSDDPAAERRQRVAPYLDRLRHDFEDHPALPAILARVERKLASPARGQ